MEGNKNIYIYNKVCCELKTTTAKIQIIEIFMFNRNIALYINTVKFS